MTRFDLMIFGATGWTGQFLVKHLATTYKNEKFSWAVAGRSAEKLDNIIESVSKENNVDLSNVAKFVVDADNISSVKNMCENAKIVINCVGPYRFSGDKIVKQCLETNTHHIDVSGEPEFLETMQVKYNNEAIEKNVFIIGSCGFDSVPADMGVIYTQNNFKNDLEYIESFLSFEVDGPFYFNYATWESAVYGFAAAKNLSHIRKELFKNRLPKAAFPAPKRSNKIGYFYDEELKKYCFAFPGSDKSVVQRTQYFNYEILNQKTVQYIPYFTITGGFFNVLRMIFYGLGFSVLANYRWGRHLLLKYHGFFSCGIAKKLATNKTDIDHSSSKFINQFRGVGHSTKLENKNEVHADKPDQLIITECSGPEGYTTTALLVLDCAFTLLQEQEKIPVKGGVLTPAAAFAKTNIIERIMDHGIKFDVVYKGLLNRK